MKMKEVAVEVMMKDLDLNQVLAPVQGQVQDQMMDQAVKKVVMMKMKRVEVMIVRIRKKANSMQLMMMRMIN